MLFDLRPRVASAVLARRTALIVEDDPRLQKSMGKHLARAGFDVLSAPHYDAAVCHLAARRPHLVCVHVGLPEKSGYELCEYIRGPLGLTLVPIILTGERAHSQEMAFAEAAGANAFLCKPFSTFQLAACVASLLDRTPWSTPPVHELARFASDTVGAPFGRRAPPAAPRDLPSRARPSLLLATNRATSPALIGPPPSASSRARGRPLWPAALPGVVKLAR